MLVADEFLGTRADSALADRLDGADALTVTLSDTERRRSRVRTAADDGTDLGVVVARDLRDGDVLDADGTPVVVSLEPVEAMVLDFDEVGGDATGAATAALALGHAVGNRHWDLAVEGERAYLPVTEDRDRMEREVDPHLPAGVTVEYEAVSPALFDDSGTGHAHGDDGHAHGHGTHSHDHDADGSHGHDHDADHTHGDDGHAHSHAHDHAVRGVDPDGGDGT